MKLFFLLFLLVPLVEIYFLIKIGGMVGAGMTVLLVIFTALLGAFLVRAQGFTILKRVQMQFSQRRLPAMEMLEGLLLFVAGALLLTPGFFTDAVGFVFLTPPLRRAIITYVTARGVFAAMSAAAHRQTRARPGQARSSESGRVIDVDSEKID